MIRTNAPVMKVQAKEGDKILTNVEGRAFISVVLTEDGITTSAGGAFCRADLEDIAKVIDAQLTDIHKTIKEDLKQLHKMSVPEILDKLIKDMGIRATTECDCEHCRK